MARTYEPIASQTLGSNASTVTFSNIPGTFTDLVILASIRLTNATAFASWSVRFNSDTATNYSYTYLSGDGASATSGRASTQADTYIGTEPSDGTTSNIFGATAIHVMSYANTNVFKTLLAASGSQPYGVIRSVSLWRSTSAITSMTFRSIGGTQGNFKAGSTFAIYGIKAA